MKFSTGGDLQKLYKKKVLAKPDYIVPEETILFWAKQLMSDIDFLHKHNIVHRDIKMANILLDVDGNLKLCDFGLCKLLEPGQTACDRCGTPVTMSPEVASGAPYRFSPDWWSFAIIIYQLMNKADPYEKPSVDELMKSIVEDAWKFTAEAIKNYSSELIDFVTKLLVKDPEQRLGTKSGMEELLAHPVFQKELISSDKVDPKPDAYDTNRDYLTVKHRSGVAAEYDERSVYSKGLAKE